MWQSYFHCSWRYVSGPKYNPSSQKPAQMFLDWIAQQGGSVSKGYNMPMPTGKKVMGHIVELMK